MDDLAPTRQRANRVDLPTRQRVNLLTHQSVKLPILILARLIMTTLLGPVSLCLEIPLQEGELFYL